MRRQHGQRADDAQRRIAGPLGGVRTEAGVDEADNGIVVQGQDEAFGIEVRLGEGQILEQDGAAQLRRTASAEGAIQTSATAGGSVLRKRRYRSTTASPPEGGKDGFDYRNSLALRKLPPESGVRRERKCRDEKPAATSLDEPA